MAKQENKRKLVFIGIDGGTFNIIDPLINQRKLPNINSFKNRAVLKSTIPPGTGVAWSSFLTGKNPGKTNIYDFTIVDDNSWKIKFVNRRVLGSKPLWSHLNESGIRSSFVNIPISYPPDEIKGLIISGIDTPSRLSNYTYPANLKEKLKEFDYDIEVSGITNKEDMAKEAIRILENRINATRYLLSIDFDFFIVLFRESDVAQHFAWGKKEVEDIYLKIDKFIGEVREIAKKKNWDIVVMSDHGHEKVEKAFNVNAWLEKEGYLVTQNLKRRGLLSSLGISRERIFSILKALRLDFLVRIVPRTLGKKIPTKNIDFEEALINGFIDLTKTKAIAKRAVKSSQIFLNKESRGGIINLKDEKKVKKEIISKLKNFLSKNKIEAQIGTKEELYGNKTVNAPDITLYMKEKGYDTLSSFSSSKAIWDKTKEEATHNTEGIIFTDMNWDLSKARIMDLTPTILDYYGVKINKREFDGRSLI